MSTSSFSSIMPSNSDSSSDSSSRFKPSISSSSSLSSFKSSDWSSSLLAFSFSSKNDTSSKPSKSSRSSDLSESSESNISSIPKASAFSSSSISSRTSVVGSADPCRMSLIEVILSLSTSILSKNSAKSNLSSFEVIFVKNVGSFIYSIILLFWVSSTSFKITNKPSRLSLLIPLAILVLFLFIFIHYFIFLEKIKAWHLIKI